MYIRDCCRVVSVKEIQLNTTDKNPYPWIKCTGFDEKILAYSYKNFEEA
jgi:hypothetical protein